MPVVVLSKCCFLFLLVLVTSGCSIAKKIREPEITLARKLDSIPSGSGIVLNNDTAWIIGDDATGIYQLTLSNSRIQKLPFPGTHQNVYRLDKDLKHDLEALGHVLYKEEEFLIAFGSGSNNVARDSLLLYQLNNGEANFFSLHAFYEQLQRATATPPAQWNIEGVAIVQDQMVLFNRGNNLLMNMKVNDFFTWLFESAGVFPSFEYRKIKLPGIGGHEARFSGATALGSDLILFSASVEDTPDWTTDGPVLGSIIGKYSLKENRLIETYLLKDEKGHPLVQKIESIDVWKHTANGLVLLAVSDNDNGTTNLFEIRLRENGKEKE